ncbi:unnamed protein product, partial [marine sediment metagenome]
KGQYENRGAKTTFAGWEGLRPGRWQIEAHEFLSIGVAETCMTDVHFGSEADIATDVSYVRFSPESGHWHPWSRCCPSKLVPVKSDASLVKQRCYSLFGTVTTPDQEWMLENVPWHVLQT